NSGRVAFAASLFGNGIGAGTGGIWSGMPGNLTLVAREGFDAPGTDPGVKFGAGLRGFRSPMFNESGQVGFTCSLTGPGVTSDNSQGFWLGMPGSASLVARTGDQAPGAAPGELFAFIGGSTPGNLGLNNSGAVAFHGKVTGPNVTTANDSAIWA